MTNLKTLLVYFCLLLLASAGLAQSSSQQPARFDLVIFGSDLSLQETEVWLKENPGTADNWHKLESGLVAKTTNSKHTTLIYRGLETNKFAGQDIRENYISIKLRIDNQQNAQLRAAYALPHLENTDEITNKIHQAIQSHPAKMKEHSMATLVFPRPHSLSQKAVIEHIEMPVRHLKPGVQEVRWLDILFGK